MAWSDAARAAALEARRRKRTALADFHNGGTPRFDPFYTSKDYRRRLAVQIKAARAALRRNPGYHERNKMNEVMEAAGRAQGWRKHAPVKKPLSAAQKDAIYARQRRKAGKPSIFGGMLFDKKLKGFEK